MNSKDNPAIIYHTHRVPDLWHYRPQYNEDGSEKHIVLNGARFHVLSYSSDGVRCSEPNCELNTRHTDE